MSLAGYTKLFNSILASTIWRAPDKTRIVWITLLAMADKHGIAEGSVPGLADFARVSIPACRRALDELSSPDEDSRSKDQEGRRIEAVEGGWRLINHGKYRETMDADARREYLKLKQREFRRKQKSTATVNNAVNKPSTVLNTLGKDVNNLSTISLKTAQSVNDQSTNVNNVGRQYTQASPSPDPSPVQEQDARARTLLPEELAERAGRLVERYGELFQEHRQGAKHRPRPNLDWLEACDLCRVWDDARLEKLAMLVLTTDAPFITKTDRGFKIFAMKASWADNLLCAWERKHGVKV